MAVESVLSRRDRVVVVDCAASLCTRYVWCCRLVLAERNGSGLQQDAWGVIVESRLLELGVEVEVVNSRKIASRSRQIALC